MIISTRCAKLEDFERIRDLLTQLSETLNENNSGWARPPDQATLRIEDYKLLLRGHCPWTRALAKTIVATDHSNAVVGYAMLRVFPELPDRLFDNPKSVHISELVVDQKVRGQGVGEALIKRAESYSRDKGISVIQVGTIANLKANCFYRKHFKGGRARAVVYSKSL